MFRFGLPWHARRPNKTKLRISLACEVPTAFESSRQRHMIIDDDWMIFITAACSSTDNPNPVCFSSKAPRGGKVWVSARILSVHNQTTHLQTRINLRLFLVLAPGGENSY